MDPGSLEVRLDTTHGRVALAGDLDLATAGLVRRAAAALLATSTPQITIDLAGLRFVDAAGLSALVHLRATMLAAGRQVRLHRPSARIRRTLAAGGLAELF
jgi:anti-anti-sigma factor